VNSPEHGSRLRAAMIAVLGLLVALAIGREFQHLAHDGVMGTSFGALVGLASGLGVYMTLGGDEG
jgi:hypothetical protein